MRGFSHIVEFALVQPHGSVTKGTRDCGETFFHVAHCDNSTIAVQRNRRRCPRAIFHIYKRGASRSSDDAKRYNTGWGKQSGQPRKTGSPAPREDRCPRSGGLASEFIRRSPIRSKFHSPGWSPSGWVSRTAGNARPLQPRGPEMRLSWTKLLKRDVKHRLAEMAARIGACGESKSVIEF